MASATSSAAAEMVPRFLLPRLSWQATRQMASRPAALATTNGLLHNDASGARQRGPMLPSQKLNPAFSRSFHATAMRPRDHHFDTLKFVKRLQSEGFTEEQSAAMMKVLNDVIEERYAS